MPPLRELSLQGEVRFWGLGHGASDIFKWECHRDATWFGYSRKTEFETGNPLQLRRRRRCRATPDRLLPKSLQHNAHFQLIVSLPRRSGVNGSKRVTQ